MNDSIPVRALQILPSTDLPIDSRDVDDLRQLLAIGRACAKDARAVDIARAVTRCIVDNCPDVDAACVYRLDAERRRVTLQAHDGGHDRVRSG